MFQDINIENTDKITKDTKPLLKNHNHEGLLDSGNDLELITEEDEDEINNNNNHNHLYHNPHNNNHNNNVKINLNKSTSSTTETNQPETSITTTTTTTSTTSTISPLKQPIDLRQAVDFGINLGNSTNLGQSGLGNSTINISQSNLGRSSMLGKSSNLKQSTTNYPNNNNLGNSTNIRQTSNNVPFSLRASTSTAFTKLNQSGAILKISSVASYFENPLKYSMYSEGHMILSASQDLHQSSSHQQNVQMQEFGSNTLGRSSGVIRRTGGFLPDGASELNMDEMMNQSLEEIELKDAEDLKTAVVVDDGTLAFKVKKFLFDNRSYILLIFSSFLFSIMAVLVKMLSDDFSLSSLEIAFVRSFYGLIGCLIILFSIKENPLGPKKFRFFLALRGVSGTISLCAYFYTLTVLPISEAVIISFTSPVITAAMAAVLLKEKWGLIEGLCAFLSLCGVTVISKPSFLFHDHADGSTVENGESSKKLIYIFIGIGGAFFTALSYIAVRKVGPTVNPFILVIYFSTVASISTLPSAFLFQSFVWPSLKCWGYITLLGVVATVAQGCVNAGIQLSKKTSQAAAMNYLQIIFTLIWSVTFFTEKIDWITLLGAGLILGCAVVTILKK